MRQNLDMAVTISNKITNERPGSFNKVPEPSTPGLLGLGLSGLLAAGSRSRKKKQIKIILQSSVLLAVWLTFGGFQVVAVGESTFERDLIQTGSEPRFPYLPWGYFAPDRVEATTKHLIELLHSRGSETSLSREVDAAVFYKVRNALALVGLLAPARAEEAVSPFLRAEDVWLRKETMDALAALGTPKAEKLLWQQFERGLESLPSKESSAAMADQKWREGGEDLIGSLAGLMTIQSKSAGQKVQKAKALLAEKVKTVSSEAEFQALIAELGKRAEASHESIRSSRKRLRTGYEEEVARIDAWGRRQGEEVREVEERSGNAALSEQQALFKNVWQLHEYGLGDPEGSRNLLYLFEAGRPNALELLLAALVEIGDRESLRLFSQFNNLFPLGTPSQDPEIREKEYTSIPYSEAAEIIDRIAERKFEMRGLLLRYFERVGVR